MVTIRFHPSFEKQLRKENNAATKEKILKQILKIAENPKAGKPMRYDRQGTRELYIPPYRLSYIYKETEDVILIIALYHKDKQ